MQNLVTVFGGSGFVGAQAVRQLAKAGWRIRVAVRNPNLAYAMRLAGDVGQVDIVQANVRNPASVRRALEGATAVVNLVGVMHEVGRQGFTAVHMMGARNVAEQARAAGVGRLVQMSAIGADANSASKYARTRAEGEAVAREIYPDAVIVRSSIVFGTDDKFFNRFAAMAGVSPALPLIGGGHTKFQPIFVGDLGKALAAAVTDPAAAGQTYELGGPGVYSFKELMELTLREIGKRRFLAPVPWPVAGLFTPPGQGGRSGRRVRADHLGPGAAAEDRQCGQRRLSGPGGAGRRADLGGVGAADLSLPLPQGRPIRRPGRPRVRGHLTRRRGRGPYLAVISRARPTPPITMRSQPKGA